MSDNPVLDVLTRIDGRLAQIDERLARFDERLTALENGQADLEGRLVILEKGQTSLRVDLMARMDRISDQITLIKDDMGVTMGASDSVQRTGDATKEELRASSDIVFTTVRQLRQLRERVDELLDRPPAT